MNLVIISWDVLASPFCWTKFPKKGVNSKNGPKLGGRFGFFFLLGEGEGGVRGVRGGRGGRFFVESPRRGGGVLGGGTGAGRVSAANWGILGQGPNIFWGRNAHQENEVPNIFSEICPEIHPEISSAFLAGRKIFPLISPDFPEISSIKSISTKKYHNALLQAWPF